MMEQVKAKILLSALETSCCQLNMTNWQTTPVCQISLFRYWQGTEISYQVGKSVDAFWLSFKYLA